MPPIRHYFAYGSNMNPARVETRGLATLSVCGARMADFALVFDKASSRHPGVAHANIRYQRGTQVEGVLFELASEAEILKMDPFEAAPVNYGRDAVQVVPISKDGGGSAPAVWAWTYFANPAVLQTGLLPEREYLDHLLAGRPFLSESYFKALESTPVGQSA